MEKGPPRIVIVTKAKVSQIYLYFVSLRGSTILLPLSDIDISFLESKSRPRQRFIEEVMGRYYLDVAPIEKVSYSIIK